MFQMLGRRISYKDAFLYAPKNLIGKNGIIMNADCYVDKGFEHLDENIVSNKTMYSLTRHGPGGQLTVLVVYAQYQICVAQIIVI